MTIKLKVIRETSAMKLGEVIEVNLESYQDKIVVKGVEYEVAYLGEYFEVVE